MKIIRILANNRKKSFKIETAKEVYEFPYSKLHLKPSIKDPLTHIEPDSDLGKEGFTYKLQSGAQDSVHIDTVLFYNKDPDYLCEMMLYNMTVEALKRIKQTKISKRQLARQLKTSPQQLYRLIKPNFYGKSINQMVRLLSMLGVTVEMKLNKAA